MFCKSLFLVGAVVALTAGGATHSNAQETQDCQERPLVKAGTLHAVAKTVGIIVGARWGSGTVTLNNGESFKFTFEGAKVMEVGISEADIFGVIYNLDKKEDFFGSYFGIGGGLATSVADLGGVSVTNGDCVVINAEAHGKEGIRLSNPIAPGGVVVRPAN